MKHDFQRALLAEDYNHFFGPWAERRALCERGLTNQGSDLTRSGMQHLYAIYHAICGNTEANYHAGGSINRLEKINFLIPPRLKCRVELLLIFPKLAERSINRQCTTSALLFFLLLLLLLLLRCLWLWLFEITRSVRLWPAWKYLAVRVVNCFTRIPLDP